MPSQQAQSTGRVDEAVICNRSSFRICEAQPSWGGRWPVVGFLVCRLRNVQRMVFHQAGGGGKRSGAEIWWLSSQLDAHVYCTDSHSHSHSATELAQDWSQTRLKLIHEVIRTVPTRSRCKHRLCRRAAWMAVYACSLHEHCRWWSIQYSAWATREHQCQHAQEQLFRPLAGIGMSVLALTFWKVPCS